jgi:hypothetical protein
LCPIEIPAWLRGFHAQGLFVIPLRLGELAEEMVGLGSQVIKIALVVVV